ncbi:16S rRNA (cytosine(967)-C(5))-methyltransferase RsmB [Gilvimarinus polysaccharolyticus]|uniref:16S rRNA (cytosine(967)-C(5))-methyltransferase RsmB n=1 Tax=Gilvimarinus polysaccharolyticus TaxID=863921 RepID=UPI0006736117|nr:16S rRNA (cytosine(967)-C(5))-methyltransferase RsmB [Gilvimarinus polysaccharolyticus]
MKPRVAAARALAELLRGKGSLSSALPLWQNKVSETDRALVQQLCYGTMRYYPRLNAYLGQLLDKPLRAKDSDITALLLLGLYQLEYTRIPDHAALGETVAVARVLKKPWATKLINGVLRRFQRSAETLRETLSGEPEFSTAHPRWLLDAYRQAWPNQAEQIVAANNAHPPFTLRVDLNQCSRDEYLKQLEAEAIAASPCPYSEAGITLAEACNPTGLPGFNAGLLSVQDEAAQLAAPLLRLKPGLRVLDACAAPGGKTGHILQSEPALAEVVALDLEERRLTRVRENLTRLNVTATTIAGDGTRPGDWWDNQVFDRILLDAPCSASGIVRRHSDIKLLRTPADIVRLAELQGELLDALWPTLATGGILLYATCSALPAENCDVISAFLARTPDAVDDPIDSAWGQPQNNGRQLLPQLGGHDGFYYARLIKTGSA